MVQKVHFGAATKLLVPHCASLKRCKSQKTSILRNSDFRHSFRLVFPVLPVENLYLRTGVFASKCSEPRPSGVSSLPPPCVLVAASQSPRTLFHGLLGVLAAIVLILS